MSWKLSFAVLAFALTGSAQAGLPFTSEFQVAMCGVQSAENKFDNAKPSMVFAYVTRATNIHQLVPSDFRFHDPHDLLRKAKFSLPMNNDGDKIVLVSDKDDQDRYIILSVHQSDAMAEDRRSIVVVTQNKGSDRERAYAGYCRAVPAANPDLILLGFSRMPSMLAGEDSK